MKLYPLVAPVELIGFARIEPQRHESLRRRLGPLSAPALHEPVHAVMRAVIAASAKFLEQSDGRAPLAPRQFALRLQDRRQRLHPGAQLALRLNRPLVDELCGARAQDLADRVARDPQLPRDPLDPLAVLEMLKPDPRDRLHTSHPQIPPKNRKDLQKP